MIRASVILLAALLLRTGCSLAQSGPSSTLNTAKLDSLFTILEKKQQVMGSLQLTRNGAVVYRRAIGLEQPGVPATTATRYRIGSITKLFTATLIMQCAEQGLVQLDAPIARWFPTLPNADRITVDQLLHHRSGLGDYTQDPAYPGYQSQPHTPAQMLALIQARPVQFEPGTRFAYCNSNYLLLGYLVEKLTRQSYAQALQQRITGKLNLRQTYYGGRLSAPQHEAASFIADTKKWVVQPETDVSVPGGAGALTSTPAELTRFMEALFAGKVLLPATLQRMLTLQDGYGAGLLPLPYDQQTGYGHFGSIDAYRSALTYFPDDKLTLAYCGNGLNPGYTVNDLLLGVLAIYHNKPYRLPTFDGPVLTSAELAALTGTYASPQMPLKISITTSGATLMGQATGQSAFPLTPVSKTKFTYSAAGLTLEFDPVAHTLMLHQGANHLPFSRE